MTPVGSVGIFGATSLIGSPLAAHLVSAGRTVVAVSRSASGPDSATLAWRPPGAQDIAAVAEWVSLCPLWILPEWLPWLVHSGCRRLVATSSTSVFTKATSPDRHDRALAARLAAAEERIGHVAADRGISLVLLRPTMVYDGARDGNVAAIAAFIRRWRFFPLAGAARGLRQPVHAADVAAACAAALAAGAPAPAYTLSGPEPLPFCELVAAIFAWLDLPPRMPRLPPPLFRTALAAAHAMGLGRSVSSGMLVRMNEDLSCGHDLAARDLDFRPRGFLRDMEPVAAAGNSS